MGEATVARGRGRSQATRRPLWRGFRALPAYRGSKRRLCRAIFGLLSEVVSRESWPGLKLVDPFLGGGSVSLFAKAQGFMVACNDLAYRSALIGRALIENSSTRLTKGDVLRLFVEPAGSYPRLAEERLCPKVFNLAQARFLDRALAWARSGHYPGLKRPLAELLIVKWALRCQPMGMLTATDAAAAATGDYDRVSPARLGHYLSRQNLLRSDALWRLAQDVNAGVFAGKGRASQDDAVCFLKSTEGDVLYLDPPYPGTSSYEEEYGPLDLMLEGAGRAASAYSSKAPPLEELFANCRHVPIWLISMGNEVMGLEELEALVRRHRSNVRSYQLAYAHLGPLARQAKNERNREYIIVAT